jgi:hypothetical protein
MLLREIKTKNSSDNIMTIKSLTPKQAKYTRQGWRMTLCA